MRRASIRITVHRPAGDRRHYVTEEDVRVVLARIPEAIRGRLVAVHLNDRFGSRRTLGYVNRGRREIGLCALPPRVSIGRSPTPEQFGAIRRCPWPTLALRRFLLYDTLLHELGHLQVIDARAKATRRRFAGEARAEEFAERWRRALWSRPFDHADPTHNPPTPDEIEAVRSGWADSCAELKRGRRAERAKRFDDAFGHYSRAVERYPAHAAALERLGVLIYGWLGTDEATGQSIAILREALRLDPALDEANVYLALALARTESHDEARRAFRRAIRTGPHGVIARTFYADALADWGCYEEARQLFARTLRRDPRCVVTIRDYGRCLARNPEASPEDIERAIALLAKAVALDPSDAYSHGSLGMALLDCGGDLGRARRHLEEAIRLKPSLTRAAEALEVIRELEAGSEGVSPGQENS